jgi:lipoprotein-anchoring transpeptidase ErfK/SrfK
VTAILPVARGATGNTPQGRLPHPLEGAGDEYLGSGPGSSIAIHGWADVPPYPASHGCVRVPIWDADWLYDRSPVGERVYVYG